MFALLRECNGKPTGKQPTGRRSNHHCALWTSYKAIHAMSLCMLNTILSVPSVRPTLLKGLAISIKVLGSLLGV
ncbi:hypothetical protein AAC387_Pa09g2261 [Persea americana]